MSTAPRLLVPVFPLPNVVFYPKTLLPLHIFEPRYRQMVAHALSAERLIGMILLRPGWEADYHESPEAYAVGCVGRIEQERQLEDGRYHLLLVGIERFRVCGYQQLTPFRIAEVELLEEDPVDEQLAEMGELRDRLVGAGELLARRLAPAADNPDIRRLSFEALVNNLAMSADMEPEEKQRLLEFDDLLERARRLDEHLSRKVETLAFFDRFRHLSPPDPSHN